MVEFWEEEDYFFRLHPQYSTIQRACNIIGAWPYGTNKWKVMRYYLTFFLLLFLLFAQLLSYLRYNFRAASEAFLILGPTAAISTFFYIVHYKQIYQIKMTLDHIRCDWCSFKTMEELVLANKYAMEAKFYLLIFGPLCYLPFFGFLFVSVMSLILDDVTKNGNYRSYVPFRIEFFLIINKEDHMYSMIFLSSFLLLLLSTVFVAGLGLIIISVQHACCMFRVVGLTLTKAFERKRLSTNKIDEDEITATIFRAIYYHHRAIEFVELLNSLMNRASLAHVVVGDIILVIDITMVMKTFYSPRDKTGGYMYVCNSMLEIQLTLLQFDFNVGRIDELCTTIVHMICMLSIGTCQCYIGQRLLDHSTAVFQETIILPWYVLPPRLQKLSLMIMMRSLKQCSLTIMKVFTLSYEMFTKQAQCAISYAMVFRSL